MEPGHLLSTLKQNKQKQQMQDGALLLGISVPFGTLLLCTRGSGLLREVVSDGKVENALRIFLSLAFCRLCTGPVMGPESKPKREKASETFSKEANENINNQE